MPIELVDICPICENILKFKKSNFETCVEIRNYEQIFKCDRCTIIFSKFFKRKKVLFKRKKVKENYYNIRNIHSGKIFEPKYKAIDKYTT